MAKVNEIDDDRAQEIRHDRGIAADERLSDEVGDLRDGGKDRDVADQQIEQRVVLLLDHFPFRLGSYQDRLDPVGKLAQVICPHLFLRAARYASAFGSCLPRDHVVGGDRPDAAYSNSFCCLCFFAAADVKISVLRCCSKIVTGRFYHTLFKRISRNSPRKSRSTLPPLQAFRRDRR